MGDGWHSVMMGGNGTFTREQATAFAKREREKDKSKHASQRASYAVKKGPQGYFVMAKMKS